MEIKIMDEKILKWFVIAGFVIAFLGSLWYFLAIVFSLLAEVKGWPALVIIFMAIICSLAVFNVLKRLF